MVIYILMKSVYVVVVGQDEGHRCKNACLFVMFRLKLFTALTYKLETSCFGMHILHNI